MDSKEAYRQVCSRQEKTWNLQRAASRIVPARIHATFRVTRAYLGKPLGFALCMAWSYHTLFLSAFGIAREPLWCAAWVWSWLECPLAVMGLVSAIVLRHFSQVRGGAAGVVAGLCGGVGSTLIGVGHFVGVGLFMLTAVGEALCGFALAVFALTWGAWLSERQEDEAEGIMVFSFGLAALLCVGLLCVEGVPRILLSALLALAAALITFTSQTESFYGDRQPVKTCAETNKSHNAAPSAKRVSAASIFILYGSLWFLFSYCRILAAPSKTDGDQLLLPFALAFVVAGAGLGLCILLSSHVNFTLVYRWSLPLIVLSCGVLFVINSEFGRALAYLLNFVAMFGAQAGCWIVAPKYVHRQNANVYLLFGGVVAAEGIGVTLGSAAGLFVMRQMLAGQVAGVSLLLVGLVLLMTMLIGFKPCWILQPSFMDAKSGRSMCVPVEGQAAYLLEDGADSHFYDLLGSEACFLRDQYGLTKRETEIAFLLLEGRNRPYIRDELIISLHTVHAHVRNIFAKCEVHSQQELIALVRPEAADDVLSSIERVKERPIKRVEPGGRAREGSLAHSTQRVHVS